MPDIQLNYQLALENFQLSFETNIPAKGVTAIFGHSGCGKSTLFRCIAGLEQAQQAYFKINNRIWDDSNNNIHLPTHQRRVGYVFQEASLFTHLSVLKNLEFGMKRSGIKKSTEQMDQAISLLGIEDLLNRKPERLSGGERQRVAIARALSVSPELLLMDEPLAALDMNRKREILPFLEQIHREMKTPVLYISHSPAEVRRLADHIIVMEAGKIISQGSLQETNKHLLDEEYY